MNYKEAQERVQLFEYGLTAYDFMYDSRVFIEHEDGTILDFNYAFYMEEEEWYYIFTEHHGAYVFYKEDLIEITAYKNYYETQTTGSRKKEDAEIDKDGSSEES